MRRPPAPVALVARTHGLVGATILVATGLIAALTWQTPVELGVAMYGTTLGLGGLYLLAGAMVWRGTRGGRFLSKVCGLLYLARPDFGSHLWRLMDSAEYRDHFVLPNRAEDGR